MACDQDARSVRAGFLELAAAEPDRWVVVDGDLEPDVVEAEIVSGLSNLLT